MNKLFFDKLNIIRKRKKITLSEISDATGLSRSTIWKWEKGDSCPKENQIRLIANVLGVPANEISDLPEEKPVSDRKLSDSLETWLELAETGISEESREFRLLGDVLNKLQHKLNNSSIIIKGLMNATNSYLYIKGTDSKFIIANRQFKESLFLSCDYKVYGKNDSDFFPPKEAQINDQEDRNVMLFGGPVINREGIIPGSRKKKWGMISKFPILDSKNHIQGVIGIIIDISERKKQEEREKKYIERIKDMEDALLNLPYLVYVHKKTGDTLSERNSENYFTNGHEYMVLGVTREDLFKVGRNWINFVLPGYRQKVIDILNSDRKNVEMEYPIKCPTNNKIRWLKESYTVYSDKVCGIVHDITDLKVVGGID